MSKYDKHILNSDLDAFKNSGVIRTASITFSGSIGGGGTQVQSTSSFSVTSPDLAQIQFDNSVQHSGRYRNLILEGGQTIVHETSVGSDLVAIIDVRVSGNSIQLFGTLFNPYATPINLQSTTINFRFIPYEATFES